ncbi:hypothetical protein [Mastigocoleus testarum]|uniref:Uncharacterized protein n=1 Tax=Mastigocoleus testarum BC008 TaxID=371196 RepID=A0A0V7ZKK2_9CYAN|nr:hypothetical protein [Mastigocoleus testarum]KST64073.1 hypothetical protein BC008_40480 [Mastigocoleus testarum BC008]KST64783.1 hypothetical protein BC008_41455 [Mastigocoleus testarum BC008]
MSEKIRVTGNNLTLRPLIAEVIALRKLIEHRDVGDIVAQPIVDYVRASPHTIRLTITFFSTKEPPFYTSPAGKRVTYNIPDVARNKLNWTTIKNAAGGANGYNWGRFRATANLDNGRQMAVYGGSENEAEQRLKSLLTLSTAKILTLSVLEEKKEGIRQKDKILYKEVTRIYPAYCSVLSSQKIVDESNRELNEYGSRKVGTVTGAFKRTKSQKIPLWVNQEPADFTQIISESLRNRGVNTQ